MTTETTTADTPPSFHNTTLGERGPQLPLGFKGGRVMVTKPWRLREEKMLADLREKMAKAGFAELLAAQIGEMYSQLGGLDLSSIEKREARTEAVMALSIGDLFYAHAWLRVSAVGHDLALEITCPSCLVKSKTTVDLRELDVVVYDDETKARVDVFLKNPITVQKKPAHKLTLKPPAWAAMRHKAKPGGVSQSGSAGEVVRSSIVLVDDEERPVTHEEIDELSFADVQQISEAFEGTGPGPKWELDIECPSCGHEHKHVLDWAVNKSFFRTSFR